MRQDAPKNGAQLFEIASSSGQTHAGLCASLTYISLDAVLLPCYCFLWVVAYSRKQQSASSAIKKTEWDSYHHGQDMI